MRPPVPAGTRLLACLVGAATAAAGTVAVIAPSAAAPLPFTGGSYVVLLDDPALASYTGGVPGLAGTRPGEGEAVDLSGTDARRYAAYLAKRQAELLEEVDAEATYSYQVAFNGFAVELDGARATKLAGLPGVTAVLPDEVRQLDTVQSPDYLGLSGDDGVWADLGGTDAAGEGVVVGVLDSGVWPENPSFAGDELREGRALRTDGKGRVVGRPPSVGVPFRTAADEVVMLKSDRTVFRGACELGEGWDSADLCNDKLISARYYADAFLRAAPTAARRGAFEFISPRDGDGHGSHTAGTAVGNTGVPMSVDGVDLGEGSGVAPGAKLAVYKVCWEGATTATTGCYTSDSVRAIEQAVIDGVDVLNYSISGSTTTVVDAVELAFYNAANAGVFVAASAGNSGPGSSTTAHNSPWVMTVGATTFKRDEGTVVLGNGAVYKGASVIQEDFPRTELVLAREAGLPGAAAAQVALCYPGTLDPAVVTGRTVVCDRGVIDRVAKSAAVATADGVAMILANTVPGSLDPDFHAVPTVHVDEVAGAAIKAYATTDGATAAFAAGDTTGAEPTPIPQIAGFSSRGPTLAAGGDILKPDIAAPGVAVIAAVAPGPNRGNDYNALSGTSMSSPHVAGLAALVLGEEPLWHPSVVKSALMTTATNLAAADGSDVTDPFVQGAGFVNPADMFTPGLVLPASEEEWGGFYAGQGLQLGEPGSEYDAIAPTDLNHPSVAISQQTGPQTVTRTFRSLQAGRWDIEVDVPGYEVTTSVAAVRGDASGRSSTSVDFTFTRTDAELAEWATGFITLEGPTTVRLPVALRPVSVAAPAEVTGSVQDGSVEVGITPGFDGALELTTAGFAEGVTESGTLAPGASGAAAYITRVPAGTSLARFDLDATNDSADLDLYVYRMNATGTALVALVGQSASGAADERVDVLDLPAGLYYSVVENFANAPGETTAAYDFTTYTVTPQTTLGGLAADPNPLDVTAGEATTFDLTWSGLDPESRYLGWVGYEGALAPTIVSVD